MGQKEAQDQNTENMLFKLAEANAVSSVKYANRFTATVLAEMQKQIGVTDNSLYYSYVDILLKGGHITEETSDRLKKAVSNNWVITVAMEILVRFATVMTTVMQDVEISSLENQYKKMQAAVPNPAPVESLVRSMMIDPGRSTENRVEMKKFGYNDTQIDNIILSHYRLYDEGVIRTCYLRGIISEERMYERMRELGYTDTRTKEIVQTWTLLPPPADLFTMVAHEAFEPEIYTKLGLAEEFPVEQVEWLKKQGISEAWAMKYWISHWAQPSIGQGFEMLHRGVIDMPTLDLLFKAVEIPSFWRDKLVKIAYQPYTRVDVRRMHDLGIIGDQQLIQAYLDLGYDAEKALNMANFTIKYNAEHQQSLTRSTILESYSEGLITRKDAMELLVDQDYSEALADYYLTLEDYKRDKEVQKQHFKNIEEQFLLGLITEAEARSALNQLGTLGNKTDALIGSWNLQKYKYQRLPTKSDLDAWLIKGLINESEYIQLMVQHGFEWRHIMIYLSDIEHERTQQGRAPTKADLDRWVKKKTINTDQYKAELKALGYADKYIAYYLKDL